MKLNQLISAQTIKKRKFSATELAFHLNIQNRDDSQAKDLSDRDYKVKMVDQDDLS